MVCGDAREIIVGLKEELEYAVKRIISEDRWTRRDGTVVPAPESLRLGNDGVNLDATVLYADMSDSTVLVDKYRPNFAAEIYKSYLACAARVLKSQGGIVTAYDGDRVMGVFIGENKETNALRAAFKINGAVWDVVKPAIKVEYPTTDYNLKHVIGVDSSNLLVSRIGVRNDNDLVWVGRAANYAAKLSALPNDFTIYITSTVYAKADRSVLYSNGQHMWEERWWTSMNNMSIYASRWKFGL
jgi:class 3 adenylate cyclase